MIYIQSDNDKQFPILFDSACAMYGAIIQDMPFELVTFDDVKSGIFDSEIPLNLFVGSVEFMKEVFSRVRIYNVKCPENSNRKYIKMSLAEAYDNFENGNKLFIKPFDIKLFTGFVLDGMIHSEMKNIPETTEVMAYEPFNSSIVSEWRVYVLNYKICDSHNYSGDFTISPNYDYVNSIIKNNLDKFPLSYTIDIGILEDKTNVVVEFNDMWSIGNYGVPNNIYLRMLRTRYFEIMKNGK